MPSTLEEAEEAELSKDKAEIPKSNFSVLGLDGRLFLDHLVYGWP